MSLPLILLLASLIDAVVGEPRALWDKYPHPAVLMGRLIGKADARFNTGTLRRAKGILLVLVLVAGAGALGAVVQALPLGWLWSLLIAASLLAQRSLADHVQAVANGLRLSLGDGRSCVSMIVGRDTRGMTESAIARSAIESAAENLSDAVIAPMFWFLILGLPGLLIYKVVNTADSMIGYLTPRHAAFGWAAARLDDVLNWVPARLTAALTFGALVLHGQRPPAFADLRADAILHRSPNAGWPEAAFARALGIALAGPRSYDGVMTEFPFVNATARKDVVAGDIDRAVTLLWRVWTFTMGAIVMIWLLV